MELKKTPFYQKHVEAAARLVDFGGWALALEYKSVLAEAKAVRGSCGLFDASHMGQIRVSGSGAFSFLQGLVTNDLSLISNGQMQYNLLLNRGGGVLDDLMVYRFKRSFLCVVNATNIDKIFNWFNENNHQDIEIINESNNISLLALQGPNAQAIMEKVLKINLDDFNYMSFIEVSMEGKDALISRSGYTGEDGFEIYVSSNDALFWWDTILKEGEAFCLQLSGLGARDILRIEAGYPLYGNDMNEQMDPFTASLGWAVKLNKEFIGKDAILKYKIQGVKSFRVGFVMEDRAIPRAGYEVYLNESIGIDSDRKFIGKVSSGGYSPNLDKFIGMAVIDKGFAGLDAPIEINVRGRFYKARIVKMPFVGIRTYNKGMSKVIRKKPETLNSKS